MISIKQKKIGILIISRTSSKRLKNKAKLKINNLSILEILVTRLLKLKSFSNLILCSSKTNNDKNFYKDISKKYGIKFFFGDEKNVLKRIIECSNKFNLKHVVRVTGDNPLTDLRLIKLLCKRHIINNNDYTFSESLPKGMRAEIFSLSGMKRNYSQILDLKSTEYLTYYFKRPEMYKIENLKLKKINKNQHLQSISIDSLKDFRLLKKLLNKVSVHNLTRKKIISFLKKNVIIQKKKRISLVTNKYDVRYKQDVLLKRKFL